VGFRGDSDFSTALNPDGYRGIKTIEAAFDLPYLGHAADPSTHTLAPLLEPND